LEEIERLYIKPRELNTEFRIYPFSELIINDKFLAYHEKIYYLNKKNMHLPTGILDKELLTNQDDPSQLYRNEFLYGIHQIEGSDQFMIVFKQFSKDED
jgi:hypothetical protein